MRTMAMLVVTGMLLTRFAEAQEDPDPRFRGLIAPAVASARALASCPLGRISQLPSSRAETSSSGQLYASSAPAPSCTGTSQFAA